MIMKKSISVVYISNSKAMSVFLTNKSAGSIKSGEFYLVTHSSVSDRYNNGELDGINVIIISPTATSKTKQYFLSLKTIFQNFDVFKHANYLYFNTEYFPFPHLFFWFFGNNLTQVLKFPDYLLVSLFYRQFKKATPLEGFAVVFRNKRLFPIYLLYLGKIEYCSLGHVTLLKVPKQVNLSFKSLHDSKTLKKSNSGSGCIQQQSEIRCVYISQAFEGEYSNQELYPILYQLFKHLKSYNAVVAIYRPHPRENKCMIEHTMHLLKGFFPEVQLEQGDNLTEKIKYLNVNSAVGFYSDLLTELTIDGFEFISYLDLLGSYDNNPFVKRAIQEFSKMGVCLKIPQNINLRHQNSQAIRKFSVIFE